MNIIICGTGQVGTSIAGHLAMDNDVTIIDSNAERVQKAADTFNLRGVIGVSSHPDILEQAGAKDADMIIAVTDSDEVNMVSCQVAHTIFNTPLKIARIRARSYLNPSVGELYSPDNLPIDHIISPETEVAQAVSRRLKVPGAFDVSNMGEGRVRIVGVRCDKSCPILGSPIRYLTDLFEDLTITIVAIIRGNDIIVARDGTLKMMEGDQVYFVCDETHMARAMASFGHEEPESRNVLISGGGTIGQMVVKDILNEIDNSRVTVIEYDKDQAHQAAEALTAQTTVIHGDALEPEILNEGEVNKADTYVALTNDDEVNVLSSLLARRFGATHTVSLVNMASFVPLISTLGVDSVINPPAITVSSILRHVRRGRVRDIHTIIEDRGEFMEVVALSSSPLVGRPLRSTNLPKNAAIGAIIRQDEVIAPRGDTVIEPNDHVILFAARSAISEVEKMLSVRPDFF
ncbi:MAG: Trk system potassium transporter TrkA [Alphaproteobacteria bacterium]|nr:Trk system potassium transporter TrkA [Alphaproteobacteria bacterium]